MSITPWQTTDDQMVEQGELFRYDLLDSETADVLR